MGSRNISTVYLPQDEDGAKIQVLAADDTTVKGFVLSAATQATLLPAGARIVEVAVTGNCKFAMGASTVDASVGTKRVLLTGVYVYRVQETTPGTLATHFDAVIVDASSGRITVTKLV